MNSKHLITKFTLIFAMLVSVLTLFLVPNNVSAETVNAGDVQFTPDDSNWQVDNVNDALEGIYQMVIEDQLLQSLETTHGTLSPAFDPLIIEYDLNLDLYDRTFVLTGETYNKSSTVTGLDTDYILTPGESKKIELTVTSEEGDIRVYTINAKRAQLGENEHSTKLENIVVNNEYSELEPIFYPLTTSYDIFLFESDIDMDLTITTIDPHAIYEVTGNRRMTDLEGTVTITVKEEHCEDTVYTLHYTKGNKDIPFFAAGYTGEYQTFIAEKSGIYKIELWGASGGKVYATYTSSWPGQENLHGLGGYTAGDISLNKNDKLYIYIGEAGMKPAGMTATVHGGWNGGGSSLPSTDNDDYGGTGGGATDVRLVPTSSLTAWNEFDSLKSRIMVAGGGGGSAIARNNNYYEAMNAGGLAVSGKLSNWNTEWTPIVNQTTGYKFGVGADGVKATLSAAGAGGGYYGGVQKGDSSDSGRSSGGSSYISGHTGSNSISKNSTSSNISHTGSSIHYTGTKFENTVMVDGTGYNWTTTRTTKTGMPTIDGTSTENGHDGNGYAKITLKELFSKDNYLNLLQTDKGTLSPSFDPIIENYTLALGVDDTKIKINARPSSDLATIDGIGEYDIPAGTTQIPITVTAESGDERVYTITVTRPASSESHAKNITITGFVEQICQEYEGYCELDNEFSETESDYYMTVPSGIRELEFTVEKKHAYETVIGDGVSKLKNEENTVTIEVTSEDGESQSVYRYHITRDLTGDNYLDSLVVTPINEMGELKEELDIGFHYLLEEYTFKVENDVTKLKIDAIPDDENATYTIKTVDELQVGENKVEVEVKAQNNEIRTYTLNVYRVSNDNPLLSNLKVTDIMGTNYTLSPEFKDVVKKYVVTVENEIESVTINGIPQKDTTTVQGDGQKDLSVGRNTYTIVSTAENGSIYTYEVVIIRLANSNNYLSTLSVLEGEITPTFDKEENSYSMTVDPHIKSLTITAEPEADTSNVTILSNSNFQIGENEVVIRVTAENSSTRDYKIIVTKEGSDNNYLSNLSVISSNTELLTNFNKETQEYEIRVGNEVESVVVSAEAEDSLSTIEGNNIYNLSTGNNTIKVKVTSETGIEREYTIDIIRDKNSDATLKAINVTSGSINLEEGIYEYTLEVDNSVEEIGIDAIPTVSTTTYEGYGVYQLEVGKEKTIELKTRAEDETTSLTYKVKITRKKNDNAYLSTLSIDEGNIKPTFVKTTNNYTLTVRNNITSLTVSATPEVQTSNVVINNPESLTEGLNEVTITVTSEIGVVNVYKIEVTRLSEEASKLNLSTLDVRGCTLTPEFNSNIYEYTCEVEYELSDTDIMAQASQEEYIVSGTGAKVLEVGENVYKVKVEDEKKTDYNEYQVNIIRKESSETRLSNITVTNHELNEIYNKDNTEYTLNTSENNLEINYTKMHEGQQVTISGNTNLSVGENVVTIHVLAANKIDSQDYTITVEKRKNTNSYLSDLSVEGYQISPIFNKGTYEYTLEVENEISQVNVIAQAEENTSTVTGDGMHSLLKGLNEIVVKVTSENEEEREYKINITRLGSRNANLSSLSVEGYEITPTFDSNVTSYTLTGPYEVENVILNAQTEEENALVNGDGVVSLNQEINDRSIIVTSENGEIKTYFLHITRSDPVTSKLKNINVQNYTLSPVFDPDTTSYTVIVDNEIESIILDIERLDPQSTYVIEGNQNFEIGENQVKVISTSSDGQETTEYVLNVVRQAYSNTYLSSLTVSDGELIPEFDKTKLSYKVEVDYEVNQITIDADAENSSAIISGLGIHDLLVGENNFSIVVELNGIRRTYNVKVIRKASNNANILSITSNLGEVEKISEEVYKLVVPYNTEEILSSNISVTTENPNAKVSKQTRLDLSKSLVYKIKVTSEDESNEKDYVINIELDKSTNNYLKNLMPSIGSLTPVFSKDTQNYKVYVEDIENEIEFVAEVEDERAEILNNSLVFELNDYTTVVEIKVESEKGEVRTYKVEVEKSLTRKKTLSNIAITGVENINEMYEFSETEYEYNITVPYEIDEIGFDITKKYRTQIVKVLKNNEEVSKYSLVVGENTYQVKVTNSYNESLIYTYNIERLKNTNNYLKSLRLTSPEKEIKDFDKELLEYEVSVPYSYENISIEAQAEDTENARVSISGTTYLIEGEINDVSIKVRAQNGSIREYIIHVLRMPESNNLLKTLTVSSGDIYALSPKFNAGVTNYTLEVPSAIELVNVEGLAEDEDAIVTGNGDYRLNIGLNKIQIKVLKDNKEKVYTVNITRLADKNVYLKTLEIDNGTLSPTFDKTRGVYTVNIPYTENSLDMNIETEDKNAKYEVIGNNNLRYGSNEVKIRVTSSDGSASKTYVLNVIKQGNIDNNLEALAIDGELVEDFNPNTTHYELEVEYEKESTLIEAIPADETASVTGTGYYSLSEGLNTINVYVTSQSGLIKTYEIEVTRKNNTYLNMLVTDRGEVSPTFIKTTTQYTLEVENEIKDITVIGIKESSNAEVTGNGKYDLNVGENTIKITVTNNGYTKEYSLVVTRKGSSNTNLKYLTVAESILDKEYSNEEDEYTVYISDDITNLSLSYEPEDETTIVEEIGNSNFDETNETVTLKVTSTGGQIREIKIHIIREDESTFSNKLLDLDVNKGTMSPKYTEDVQEYTVTVPSNTKDVTITAVKRGNQTVEGAGTVTLSTNRTVQQVKVTSKDGKTRIYTLIIYKQASNDARIEILEFNEGYLSPAFNKNVYNYTLIADSESVMATIKNIKTVDQNATYQVNGGVITNNQGLVQIIVTSADSSVTKTYKVLVRLEKSSNAYLSSLTTSVGTLNPIFNKTRNTYEVNVGSDVNDIIITGTSESTKAFVTGNAKYDLDYGNNYINIIVTSEAGTTNTYSINVIRAYKSNAKLKDLYVRGYEISPEFDEDTLGYTLTVENDVDKVTIEGELSDEESTVSGFGEKDLSVGLNTFDVVVTSQNGDIKTYTIEITRKKLVSSKIESLEIKEGLISPTFMSDYEYYTVNIPNEYDKITPIIKLVDEDATYEIIGNSNLQVGNNEVQIKVTSSDNSEETTYYITVVRNVSTNNYLKNLTVSEGTLSPEFNKTTGYYEVEVENDVEKITLQATTESSTTSIRGIGEYTLNVGDNLIVIQTRSASGITRAYQVKVIRKAKENNYLKSLVPSVGVLSPEFNKETLNYTIGVPEGTSEITLTAEPEEVISTISGDGLHSIVPGDNNISIIVTSESGDVKTYTVKVTRGLSNNTNIESITPSNGTLSPEYNDEINKYNINVSNDTNILDFDIILESENATVTGHKSISIDQNSKTQIITVTAEDGTVREIEINITKETLITDIILSESNVTIIKSDTYQIELQAVPEGSSNNFEYTPEDETIVSIDSSGLITGLKVGSTKVTITTPDNELIEKEMQVTVLNNVIESSELDVRENEDKVVIGAEIEETIKEFKEELNNEASTIKIYDTLGNLLSDDDIVKTGLIIKLEYNDKVYDEAIMVVRGDVDGDGYVNVTDYMMVLNHSLELTEIEDSIRFLAADVEEDELINVTDYIKIMDYSLENLDTLN